MVQLVKPVHAVKYNLEGPGIVPGDNPVSQVESIISGIFGFLTVIAVVFFTIQLILAGYGFISSQGDKEKIATARKKLTNGILGITIVVVAYGFAAFLSRILGLGDIFNLETSINLITPK